MAAYVLVGGAWLGGWCWQPVARRLREAGHEAYAVTLTGLGERSHLSNPEVNLDIVKVHFVLSNLGQLTLRAFALLMPGRRP